MRMIRFGVLVFAVLLLPVAQAAQYYVDNVNGKNANDGQSAKSAFMNLYKASSVLKPGDTLSIINTGKPYLESLRIVNIASHPGKPVVVEGNGAVLSGLRKLEAKKWQKVENGVWRYKTKKLAHHCVPAVLHAGKELVRVKKGAKLAAGEWDWNENGIEYLPAEGGELPELYATMLNSGVVLVNASNVVIRNLVCERFHNDGFNIHSDCQGLIFENIVGRYNGDDGFSIHEDGGALVLNSHFHHNTYGVQDINAARSYFNGVLIENNRMGVHFSGGMHELVNCVIRNNVKGQVLVTAGAGAYYLGKDKRVGFYTGDVFVKNSVIEGDGVGLNVNSLAKAAALNCVFRGLTEGVRVSKSGFAWVRGSVFEKCKVYDIVAAAGDLLSDCNVFTAGKIKFAGKVYDVKALADYTKASKQDENSKVMPVTFAVNGKLSKEVIIKKMRVGLSTAEYKRLDK